MKRLRLFALLVASLPLACRTSESPPKADAQAQGSSTTTPAAPILSSDAPREAKPAMPILSAHSADGSNASASPAPTDRMGRMDAIAADYSKVREEYEAHFKGVKSQEEFEAIFKTLKEPDTKPFIARAWALVDEAPADDASFRALSWILQNNRGEERVADVLAKHHMGREGMADLCDELMDGQAGHEDMVRQLSRSSPHASVRGRALYAMVSHQRETMMMAREVQSAKTPEDVANVKSWAGDARFESLRTFDFDAAQKQTIEMLRAIEKDYGDVKVRRGTLGDVAKAELFELEHLSVGQVAPEITGEDVAGLPMKLTDFRGKVVLLDFWGNW